MFFHNILQFLNHLYKGNGAKSSAPLELSFQEYVDGCASPPGASMGVLPQGGFYGTSGIHQGQLQSGLFETLASTASPCPEKLGATSLNTPVRTMASKPEKEKS